MAKILLIYPATDVTLAYEGAEFDDDGYKSIPVGNLFLATFMSSIGHAVKFIDARVYPKKEIYSILDRELPTTDIVGFSVMTCQIRHALKLADHIREKNPDLPIVWGGIHPTLFPEQTVIDKVVDYVIAGEGEYPLRDLINIIENRKGGLKEIPGLAYKENGGVRFNGVAPLIDVNELPMPDYTLLDIDKYINRHLVPNVRVRGLDVLSSRGCPYRCAFCTNTFLLKRKWRPIDVEKVLKTTDELIERYKLNNIWFVDDFFFGDRERPKIVAKHLLKQHYNILWEADIRADNFRQDFVNDEYLDLLKSSGLYSLRMGAESGSDKTLKLIRKDITVEQTYNAVRECSKYNIKPVLFFMIGMPQEDKQDVLKTISFIMRLKGEFSQTWIYGPGIFRLYPGSELYQKCVEAGAGEPTSLREWGSDRYGGYVSTKTLPWLKGKQRFIEDLVFYNNMFLALVGQHPNPGLRPFFGRLAFIRNKLNFWSFRWEAAGVRFFKFIRDMIFAVRNNFRRVK